MTRCILCVVLLITLTTRTLQAQPLHDNYVPYAVHNEHSRDVIRMLEDQLDEEIQNFGESSSGLIRRLCVKRIQFLIKQVKARAFVKNDTLEQYLNDLVNNTAAASKLSERKRRVLVLNSPTPNAFCYGRGLFIVTVGLLGRVHSEDALAFILGHELAHDELRHVQEKIIRITETNLSRRTDAQIRHILTGEITVEEIEELRKLIYNISEYDRAHEMQADSLGYTYYVNAGYAPRGAIEALHTLDSLQYPRYDHPEFFKPLTFSKYPFQEYWLKKRLSVYSAPQSGNFMFSPDSLLSHPDLAVRRARLTPYVINEGATPTRATDPRTPSVLARGRFQTAEAAYRNMQHDVSLFHLLQLLQLYPDNRYLIARTTQIFLDLYDARSTDTFEYFASKYTRGYGDRLLQVNSMLYNINLKETGEIGYHFINNQDNFNPNDERHYYLLWQLCGLTGRENVQTKIEAAYRKRFNKKISSYIYR